ncbi:ras-like GTP-binding protein rhoA [Strongylocentrotus purpuratus]|uniref:Rho GTPase n=1 Tax=Strongylocentrotus purpuratus TaxID=7668 RepID=A0A7M7MZK1_STRPU|nr:ras-like GTP-binding protein rhoA [Strongylocentrotus purpuratus]XP_030828517.1 ras-like GTP-binding protein rhoA [Strongylocentrotus purpuratus]
MAISTIRTDVSIVGSQCGKTSLQSAFVKGRFDPRDFNISRAEIEGTSCIEVNGQKIELGIWDTPSQELYGRLRTDFAYPKTDVVVLCFSFDKPNSFEDISKKWIPEVKKYLPKAPIILVGNKKDLQSDKDTIQELLKENQEPVKTEDAQALAEKIGAISYLECSAKENKGIREVFEALALAGIKQDEKKKSSKCTIF